MPAWTLSIGDTTKSLAAWGVVDARMTFRSLDDDELVLMLRGDVFGAAPWSFGDRADLYRDATHYFQGTVTDIRATGTPRESGWTITISNVWWQLKRTMFTQPMASFDPGSCTISPQLTTKVVLFQDPTNNLPITASDQVQNIINAANAFGLPIVLGVAPAFVRVPYDVARDLTFADVIRRALQPTPDAVSWFDYSGGTPIFNYQQRPLLAAVALDFAAAPSLIEEFQLHPRMDLVPAGVTFAYINEFTCGSTSVPKTCPDPATGIVNPGPAPVPSSSPQSVVHVQQDFSGIPLGPGTVFATFDLSPDISSLSGGSPEAAPVGLAAQYYTSLLLPQWEGSVTLHEPECSGLVRPGKVVNFTSGNAAWTGIRAMVQEVHESLLTGQTVVTFGPANHLGPQDFISLVQWSRRKPTVSEPFPATRPAGTPDAPNCPAGKNPAAQKVLAAVKAGSGDVLGTINLELCDPPGSIVTVYAPHT